jgi:hypothetical protein
LSTPSVLYQSGEAKFHLCLAKRLGSHGLHRILYKWLLTKVSLGLQDSLVNDFAERKVHAPIIGGGWSSEVQASDGAARRNGATQRRDARDRVLESWLFGYELLRDLPPVDAIQLRCGTGTGKRKRFVRLS